MSTCFLIMGLTKALDRKVWRVSAEGPNEAFRKLKTADPGRDLWVWHTAATYPVPGFVPVFTDTTFFAYATHEVRTGGWFGDHAELVERMIRWANDHNVEWEKAMFEPGAEYRPRLVPVATKPEIAQVWFEHANKAKVAQAAWEATLAFCAETR